MSHEMVQAHYFYLLRFFFLFLVFIFKSQSFLIDWNTRDQTSIFFVVVIVCFFSFFLIPVASIYAPTQFIFLPNTFYRAFYKIGGNILDINIEWENQA